VTDTAPPRTSQRRLLPLCLLVTAGLADATLGLVGASLAAAQTSDRPIVSIAATVTAEAANQAPFPVRIGPPASIPRDSFVKVRGLPAMAALSEGHAISPGSWAIALNALPNLKILLPAGVTGSADIVVSLVGLDGAVLAEAKSTLVVRGAGPGASSASASVQRPALERRAPDLTPQDRQRAVGFVKKGEELMASGNVEAARLFYERAADAGLAQGALALAATFDPDELARRQVVGGLRPDPAAAKRWYERARELGADEADEPLRRLTLRQP
jgi:TPR repeat protein